MARAVNSHSCTISLASLAQGCVFDYEDKPEGYLTYNLASNTC
jgi:hypothetical protein